MCADDDARSALWAYTLGLGDPAFLHQHAVDAFGAQCAAAETTAMQLTFALVGLFLHVERGYTGRQVQQVHAALARRLPRWPALALPVHRGAISAAGVVAVDAGPARDAAIEAWCAEVWAAYAACRPAVIDFLRVNAAAH